MIKCSFLNRRRRTKQTDDIRKWLVAKIYSRIPIIAEVIHQFAKAILSINLFKLLTARFDESNPASDTRDNGAANFIRVAAIAKPEWPIMMT